VIGSSALKAACSGATAAHRSPGSSRSAMRARVDTAGRAARDGQSGQEVFSADHRGDRGDHGSGPRRRDRVLRTRYSAPPRRCSPTTTRPPGSSRAAAGLYVLRDADRARRAVAVNLHLARCRDGETASRHGERYNHLTCYMCLIQSCSGDIWSHTEQSGIGTSRVQARGTSASISRPSFAS
jgi:hypothetical protein